MDPAWAPDSRWITYTKQLKNVGRGLCLLSRNRKDRAGDGWLERCPRCVIRQEWKVSLFHGEHQRRTIIGLAGYVEHPESITRSAYVMVLRKDQPSPLAPESDEEKVQDLPSPNAEAG